MQGWLESTNRFSQTGATRRHNSLTLRYANISSHSSGCDLCETSLSTVAEASDADSCLLQLLKVWAIFHSPFLFWNLCRATVSVSPFRCPFSKTLSRAQLPLNFLCFLWPEVDLILSWKSAFQSSPASPSAEPMWWMTLRSWYITHNLFICIFLNTDMACASALMNASCSEEDAFNCMSSEAAGSWRQRKGTKGA